MDQYWGGLQYCFSANENVISGSIFRQWSAGLRARLPRGAVMKAARSQVGFADP